MIKYFQKFTSLLLLFSLVFMPGHIAMAEDEEDGPTLQTGCIVTDYLPFILNEVSYPGDRDEGIESSRLAYVTDIWKLSYCQVLDVLELYDELEALRDAFRSSAAACADTSEYKERYKQIMLELYFIRRVQPISSGLLREYDLHNLEEREEETLIQLEKEMVEMFAEKEGYISEGELRLLFDGFVAKYEDKIANYRKCDDGPWAQLQEPFVSFVETLKELQEFGQDLEVPNYKEIYSMDTLKGGEGGGFNFEPKINDGGIVNAVQNTFDYFKARKKQKKDEIEQPTTAAGATKDPETGESTTVTIDEALAIIEGSEVNYASKDRHADRLAAYEILYGQGGAQAASDMAGIVNAMNGIIEHSNTVDLPQITIGATKIYDKQCR